MRSLRNWVVLSGAVLLAACGGDTGPQTVGNVAPPAAAPTPTHSFVEATEVKSYEGIGVVQHYAYSTQSNGARQTGQLYAGDANSVRDSGIELTYNPRDAIFELTISRPLADVEVDGSRFQDPAHRTDFGGIASPQAGVPQFSAARNIQYLEAGSSSGATLDPSSAYANQGLTANNSDYVVGANGFSSTIQTFFYQKPGTTTQYVTYAGFVRNTITATEEQPDPLQPAHLRESYSFDRAAFAFGERTANGGVPTSGTGSYSGEMIASLVYNPLIDSDPTAPTYLQWMEGNHTTTVDFGSLSVSSLFTGTVSAPILDAYTSGVHALAGGTAFRATSEATIDLVSTGGFTGSFSQACFAVACTSANSLNIAGSSIDGAFFGPNGEEIGGGFRIVGGTPDERIDILGAFTGKK